jgi:hypothetical protein
MTGTAPGDLARSGSVSPAAGAVPGWLPAALTSATQARRCRPQGAGHVGDGTTARGCRGRQRCRALRPVSLSSRRSLYPRGDLTPPGWAAAGGA